MTLPICARRAIPPAGGERQSRDTDGRSGRSECCAHRLRWWRQAAGAAATVLTEFHPAWLCQWHGLSPGLPSWHRPDNTWLQGFQGSGANAMSPGRSVMVGLALFRLCTACRFRNRPPVQVGGVFKEPTWNNGVRLCVSPEATEIRYIHLRGRRLDQFCPAHSGLFTKIAHPGAVETCATIRQIIPITASTINRVCAGQPPSSPNRVRGNRIEPNPPHIVTSPKAVPTRSGQVAGTQAMTAAAPIARVTARAAPRTATGHVPSAPDIGNEAIAISRVTATEAHRIGVRMRRAPCRARSSVASVAGDAPRGSRI